MKTGAKILLPVMWFATMAVQCERIVCECTITQIQSLAAGWCTITVDCDGTEESYNVSEQEAYSYNVGDCYP